MIRPSTDAAAPLLGFVVAAGALYLAQPLLMPLALAGLLAFWLVPVVTRVERWGAGRVLAILAVCVGLVAAVSGLVWVVGREAAQLAGDVPAMRRNLVTKAHSLRGPLGSVVRASTVLEELESELEVPTGPQASAPKVEVVERPKTTEMVTALVGPLLVPLGTGAAVVVLTIFMLLGREDLRDRAVRLAGADDLTLTTRAIDDASLRLSRFLGAQSLLCAAHGSMVAVGLALIGVPGALLWGVLGGLLRFIPYLGPWIAAALPIALSLAAFPGWWPAVQTIGFFVLLELVSNNVLEPWLHGTRTGLSPFAVVLSAFFWTWLWGLPGLFLATPLTVCLVVAGRYVESLNALHVLFSDEAALDPEVRFYQRLLALDADEATSLLRAATAAESFAQATDALVLPAIRRLERDLARHALTRERAQRIRELLTDAFEELAVAPEAGATRGRVRIVSGREEIEALAAAWAAQLLVERGFEVALVARGRARELAGPLAGAAREVLCVSGVGPSAVLQARRQARELARRTSSPVVLATWSDRGAGDDDGRIRRVASGCELVAAVEEACPAPLAVVAQS
jgi:predicted PurR-regulated permease PerM